MRSLVCVFVLLSSTVCDAGLFFGPNIRIIERPAYTTTRVYVTSPVYVVKPNVHQRKAIKHAAKAAYHQVLSDNKE